MSPSIEGTVRRNASFVQSTQVFTHFSLIHCLKSDKMIHLWTDLESFKSFKFKNTWCRFSPDRLKMPAEELNRQKMTHMTKSRKNFNHMTRDTWVWNPNVHNCSERHVKFWFGCIQLPHLERPSLSDYEASTSFHVFFCEKAPDQTGRGLSSERYAGPVLVICLWCQQFKLENIVNHDHLIMVAILNQQTSTMYHGKLT